MATSPCSDSSDWVERPHKRAPRSSSPSKEAAQDSESQDSNSLSDSFMSSTPIEVRDNLRSKWLFINDTAAEETGASLIAKATGILDQKRGLAWSEQKLSEALPGIKRYYQENEPTLLST